MSGHLPVLQQGFNRQLWISLVGVVLLASALALALHAIRANRELFDRLQHAPALAESALQLQHLVVSARRLSSAAHTGSSEPSAAGHQRDIDMRLTELAALARTPEEREAVERLGQRLREAGVNSAAPLTNDVDDAVLDLVKTIRDRTAYAALDAARFNDRVEMALVGSILLIVVLVVAGVVGALRVFETNRRLMGRLDQLAHEDALTGVMNRRGLDESLPVEMTRAQRLGYRLTVAMLDFDHFKRFNDKRGHGAGDALLRNAAQAWRRQLRPTDLLARYGGEEFTLVLPACDADEAAALIERLRPLMPEHQTFSAGVATWNGADPPEELLRAADIALLAAKRAGRNRTVVAGREPQMALPLRVA